MHGLGVGEGLERAAGLPVGLGREVELHLVEVRAADHRLYRAGGGVDGDQGRRWVAGFRVHDGVDGLARHGLQVGVEGGMDLQSPLVEHVVAVFFGYLPADGVKEVLVVVLVLDPAAAQVQLRSDGLVVLLLGDVAVLEHLVQHDVAPLLGAFRIYKRVVDAGEVDDPGQKRRLGEGEVGGVLVEVGLGGGLGAVGVGAEVHGVQVLFQDLVFGVPLLVLPGERGLYVLPLEAGDKALLLGYVGVLYELLGQGGAALLDGEARHVLHGRAAYGLEVQSPVLVEAVVFDRDDGLPEGGVHLVQRHHEAVLDAVELVDDLAVRVVDQGGLGELGGAVVVEVGHVGGEGAVRVHGAGDHPHAHEHRHEAEQQDDGPESLQELALVARPPAPAADPDQVRVLHEEAIIQNGRSTPGRRSPITATSLQRNTFPALATNDFAYLNTGSSGPPPYHVIEATRKADDLCSGPAYLEGVGLFYRQAEYASQAREAAARVIGAGPDDVALTQNTTHGMNLGVASINWREGDEAISVTTEHPGCLAPLHNLKRRYGVNVRLVEPPVTPEKIDALLTPKTRLVALSHVDWTNGEVLPLQEICDLARERGVPTLVDGAQSVG